MYIRVWRSGDKMNNKKMIILLSLSIICTIAIVSSTTYAYLSVSSKQSTSNQIVTGCFSTSFTGTNNINMTSYPMSNAKGLKLTPYKFIVTNNCSSSNNYQIYLNVLNDTSTTLLNYINYSLDGSTVKKISSMNPSTLPDSISTTNISKSYLVDSGVINTSKEFNLYLWINESAGNDIMGSSFKANITVYNSQG